VKGMFQEASSVLKTECIAEHNHMHMVKFDVL